MVPVYSRVKRTEKRAMEKLGGRASVRVGWLRAVKLQLGLGGAYRDPNAAINFALKSRCGEGLEAERT